MRKKNKIIIFIIIFLIIISIVVGVGLTYIVKITLPQIRHQSSLQGFYDYIMCYRCINANYSKEETEDRLLSEMKIQHLTLDEVEDMIFESKKDVVNDLERLHEDMLFKKVNDNSSEKADIDILKKEKNIKEKSILHHDKIISIIQKLKQEEIK